MGALEKHLAGRILHHDERALAGALVRIDFRTEAAVAELDSVLGVQQFKAHGVAILTASLAHHAAKLGQVENQLAEMVPGSAARVGFIIDRGILALAEILDDSVHELRRVRP